MTTQLQHLWILLEVQLLTKISCLIFETNLDFQICLKVPKSYLSRFKINQVKLNTSTKPRIFSFPMAIRVRTTITFSVWFHQQWKTKSNIALCNIHLLSFQTWNKKTQTSNFWRSQVRAYNLLSLCPKKIRFRNKHSHNSLIQTNQLISSLSPNCKCQTFRLQKRQRSHSKSWNFNSHSTLNLLKTCLMAI